MYELTRRTTSTVNTQPLEKEWESLLQNREECPKSSKLLTICGPSGSGKTTVVQSFADEHQVFVETTEGNPYLQNLLEGKPEFDAALNQEWFLERVANYVAHAKPNLSLVIDQDPAGIVLAYSRMFLKEGSITQIQYTSLLQKLLKCERLLRKWKHPRAVLFLDAPAEVLRQRVIKRWGESRTPPLTWFNLIRNQFLELFTCFPHAVLVSTDELTTEEVISRARSLLQMPDFSG